MKDCHISLIEDFSGEIIMASPNSQPVLLIEGIPVKYIKHITWGEEIKGIISFLKTGEFTLPQLLEGRE
jgi:hypothetical protein